MAATVLSYGGGVQTVAMCELVRQGILPIPDAVIAADTSREMPTTWEYSQKWMVPRLAEVGLTLHVASHDLATVDIYGHNGDLLVPAFTETGKFQTFCSTEWKARVVRRYATQVLGLTGPFTNWIGFSLDEARRVKGHDGRRYPLIELCLTRQDCLTIIERAGLPIPPKSRCWMCPHQHNAEWREVKANPALWNEAVALDTEIRENDDRQGVFLHAQRVPLADADLDIEDRAEPTRQCGLGMCFV
jgi:hypothetical protein